ncbi:MAG: tetratricopeptide repeat protein [Deltaproteobacteria bacterium]|nr:MAG: tetratricopeptide repeat protein [Deltaproteobacteria bacterium]
MQLRFSLCTLVAMALCACGRPAARLEQARDLALSGHHQTALLEARAVLLTLRDERSGSADTVRRGALKLAGDLCALHLDDPRCAATEYRERGALEAWRDQVATAPDRPGADVAQLKIARALAERGEYHDARAAAAELISRWPRSSLAAAAALLSASTYHLSGRHADAIAEYDRVERKYHGAKQGAEALFEKGNCLAELGDDEGAVKAYTDALPRHDSPDAVQFAMERAERRLDRGRAVNPHNQAAVWDRGLAQRRAVRASRLRGVQLQVAVSYEDLHD